MVRTAPDGYDVMVFKLDETGPTYVNGGTAGAAANLTQFGTPVTNAQGILGDAMYIPSAYLVNARNGAGGANDTLISPNISLSAWVFIRRGTNYAAEILSKQYFLNGWSSPFLTFGFQTHTTSDGECDLYITLNGTLQVQVRTPSTFPIPIGKWAHIGGTWDGTTCRFYINGTLSASSNFSGVIDYGTAGNRGQWLVGGIPGTSVNADSPVIIQDARIANIVRPQSYFQNIYFNGMYVNG